MLVEIYINELDKGFITIIVTNLLIIMPGRPRYAVFISFYQENVFVVITIIRMRVFRWSVLFL